MPRASRRSEIEGAIREYLKGAVGGSAPFTDEILMAAAKCSRRTFYRYVCDGSAIKNEITHTRDLQQKSARAAATAPAGAGDKETIKRLREAAENAKNGARELMASQVRFVSNLIELGVPPSIIDKAQRDAMSKPDRRVSRAGYPRNRARRNNRRY